MWSTLPSEVERQIRERRTFWLTAFVGIGSLCAVIYFGHQQTQDNKRLLSVQLAREFGNGFDSKAMLQHRADTADALLRRQDPPTDDVPDFFDSIGFYAKRGAIDEEVVWNDFGYTITHYWPALKAYAARVRTGPDGDPDYWVNFEWLNDKLLQDHPHSSPATEDVQEFLKHEAALLKPAKSAPPRKVRRGKPRG
jgi:hypothetical protein